MVTKKELFFSMMSTLISSNANDSLKQKDDVQLRISLLSLRIYNTALDSYFLLEGFSFQNKQLSFY